MLLKVEKHIPSFQPFAWHIKFSTSSYSNPSVFQQLPYLQSVCRKKSQTQNIQNRDKCILKPSCACKGAFKIDYIFWEHIRGTQHSTGSPKIAILLPARKLKLTRQGGTLKRKLWYAQQVSIHVLDWHSGFSNSLLAGVPCMKHTKYTWACELQPFGRLRLASPSTLF